MIANDKKAARAWANRAGATRPVPVSKEQLAVTVEMLAAQFPKNVKLN